MAYDMADRKHTPDEIGKPCESPLGGVPTMDGYLAAERMGIHEGVCPFGSFVEEFPIEPEADAVAEAEGMWMVAVARSDGKPLEGHEGFRPGNFTWVPMGERPDGAALVVPNTAGLRLLGLLPTSGYSCPVFGHDCPAYYGFDTAPDKGVQR